MTRKERRKAARKTVAAQIRSSPELQDLLRTAVSHHQAGRLAQAEVIYRQIVQLQPDHADALHLMGVLSLQVGRHDASVNYIGQALACNPRVPDYHYNLGLALAGQGKLVDATRHFRKAIALKPDHAEAHNNLGNSLKEQGKLQEAARHYRRALGLRPDYAAAHNNLGTILQDGGGTDEAVVHYRKAIEIDPGDAETHYNLGNALRNLGCFVEAIEEYKKTIDLSPGFADAHVNLGSALKGLGQLDAAIENYEKALKFESGSADIYNNLGNALQESGKLSDAIINYRKAIDIDPRSAEAHHRLGIALKQRGQLNEAIVAYEQALAFKPDFTEAHNNLGNALKEQGQLTKAIAAYQQALALKPDFAEAHYNVGIALTEQGRLTKAIAAYQQALALKPDFIHAHSSLLACLHYGAGTEPAEVFIEHQRWAQQHARPLADTILPHTNDPTPDRRLRIGYVSPDFRMHSVAYFVEPLLASHDRAGFEVICYANVVRPDPITKRLQSLVHKWRNIVPMSDAQVAELMRADRVDILVDLAGHTRDTRLMVFARKPAPVQISYLGYANTTGLATMDYRLTDAWADPPGQTDNFYTEELVRLPQGFNCYQPPPESPEVGPLPALTAGHVTLASFNNTIKVNREVVALWSKILQMLPDARLIMKAWQLRDVETRQRLEDVFQQNRVSMGRIELLDRTSSIAEHLELYNRVDIGLDTFPYNGTTTTCEALWMGVPVIVLAGNTHAARTGVSVLSNVGLPELIAETPEAYVELAIRLGRDPERLHELRAGLRDKMKQSRLMDAVASTRTVEAAYRTMWGRWCKGRMSKEPATSVET